MSNTGENMIHRIIRDAINGDPDETPVDRLASHVSVRLHNSGFLLKSDRSGTERVVHGALQACRKAGRRRAAAKNQVASVYSALRNSGLIFKG